MLVIQVITRLAMENDWLLEEGWGLFLVWNDFLISKIESQLWYSKVLIMPDVALKGSGKNFNGAGLPAKHNGVLRALCKCDNCKVYLKHWHHVGIIW